MVHDKNNPRTKKYSKFKSYTVKTELFLKKSFYLFFVLLNFFFHSRKKKYLDIGKYQVNDARFINFIFISLKKKYNFSYDVSFSLLNFVKKIGIKNFMLHSTPNKLIKDDNKIEFLVNSKKIIKNNQINFNTNYFSNKINNEKTFYLPYYMYPKVYNQFYSKLENLKKSKKKIKIFFSGSTNNDVYGKFNWFDKNNKKLMNRVEIIDFIKKTFKDKIFFLNNYKDIIDIDHNRTPIVLSVNDNLVKKTKTNLSNIEHFDLISQSHFFLTAPGGDMPLCHHLIEAIKMQTIPISNYANLHRPILESDSYLGFDSKVSLENSINLALEMNSADITYKQKKLENMYKKNLSPQAFSDKFENRTTNEIIACNDVESLKWLN
tara:strand:+ start:1804 stop:2934 length:1131 start_codon:yes stop_codon:yes gene_type:complete